MKRIDHFAYEYEFLSNFYPCKVWFEGRVYATTEHAYQASKTRYVDKREVFSNEFNPNLTAAKAKAIGQNIEVRDDWEMVKVPIMRGLLLQKFEQPYFKEKLLKTEDAYLEEGNHWHDIFWGVCHHKMEGKTCREPEHRPFGGNHLGYLLMDVRNHFRTAPISFLVLS